jgi:hypothetical protein
MSNFDSEPENSDVARESVGQRDRAVRAVLSLHDATNADSASRFMRGAWSEYEQYVKRLAASEGRGADSYKSLNGGVFQALVEAALLGRGVRPFYSQARMNFIAVAIYDIVVYTQERGPVNLSLKTTIRERWKQADLEGAALKNVYKRSRVYVVNNSPAETEVRRRDLHNCISIDDFIVCSDVGFDQLIQDLISWKPIAAPTAPLIQHATAVRGT